MFFYGVITFGGGDAIAEQVSERQTEVPRSVYEDLSTVRELSSAIEIPEESTEGGSEEGSGIDSEEVSDGNGTVIALSDNNVDSGDYSGRTVTGSSSSGLVGDSRGGAKAESSETAPQTYVVTAYTAGVESTGKSPGDVGYGITASGATVQAGRTLACPPSLDFGTVVEIEGIGERVCEDRGSAITEGRLDVYIEDLDEAVRFGRQNVEVRVID